MIIYSLFRELNHVYRSFHKPLWRINGRTSISESHLSAGRYSVHHLARTISRIDPEQFRLCFVNWMQDVHEATQGQVIAIDGKTLRRSYQRGDKHSTIHMVNAFSCANKLVLGQVKTAAKSNEITATPELIELLDIDGTLVSIDAMGCQTDIAQHIVDKGGDYLFTLKSNHKKLHSGPDSRPWG